MNKIMDKFEQIKFTKEEQQIIDEFKSKIKSNPNHFIIIDKYNRRIFNKYKYNLFPIIEKYINKFIESKITSKYFFDNFTTLEANHD